MLLSTVAFGKPVHLQWTGTAKAKDDQFTCCNFTRAFWEESLHKHPCGWSCSWCGSSSCVKCCTWAASAECAASTRPQRLPLSRPICSLVCAPEYTGAWLSSNGGVHGWGLLHQRRDLQQPCLGRSKPSCCICSLPPAMLCGQRLGRYC